MIVFSEIRPGDLIKILVVIDDVEDELYANVAENREDYLIVKYYSESSLVYKNATVYILDEEENLLRGDSILEHHESCDSVFSHVKDDMYVLLEEVDIEDDDSEIHDESEDDGSDLESFIVSDTDIDGEMNFPPITLQSTGRGTNGNLPVQDLGVIRKWWSELKSARDSRWMK